MLAEALVYLTSLLETPPPFRRHLYDAVGLWGRGMRQAPAWVPHIGHTRGLIDNAIDEITPRRSVVVLGSGPLFDVPLESLARTFETVWLVDQIHLSTIERRIGRYDNVRRLWRDLSSATNPQPLDFLHQIPDLDWVISVNLLSQLARSAPDEQRRMVVGEHLDDLVDAGCPVTLVSDVDYRVFDRAGKVLEETDLLYGYKMPKPDLTWKWEVAPFGEESPETRRVHQVAGWLDWRRSSPR
jgi:hypothetical protein